MRTLTLLIKPVSGSCNMRCRYCFYADVAGGRELKNRGVMSAELLETLVKKALAETSEYCVFAFQGGEPTLAGLDFFRTLIDLEKKHNINGVKIHHAIQTNGLLMSNAWAGFFRENDFLVGLSIDAFGQIHDSFRFDAQKNGTHSRCVRAARILAKHNAEFNILSVITGRLAAYPDRVYRFYKANGFRYIQFIPCIDDLNGVQDTYSPDAGAYGAFLCRIFDLWYSDLMRNDYYSIRTFDNYIQMLAGRPAENCAMNGVCSVYALVEADGSVYPCDFYAADQHLLGSIETHGFAEMLNGAKAKAFAQPSAHPDPACPSCEYFFLCRGGCRRDREPLSADGRLSLNRYCEAYREFFRHALPRMRSIARKL